MSDHPTPPDINDVEDPMEALATYAQIVEHQQGLLDEKQEAIEEQATLIQQQGAQIEALKDSLMQQVEHAVVMKAEVFMAQGNLREAQQQSEALQSMLGMGEDSKET